MPKSDISMVIPKIDELGGGRLRISTEAITSLEEQANGDRAIRSILEHDPHYFPLGKITEVSVEEKEDHFVVRTIIDDTHEARHFHHQGTNAAMVEVTFTNDPRPFVQKESSGQDATIEVEADLANFQDPRSFNEFVTEVVGSSDLADHAGLMVRRSLIPEPLIQFMISYPELAAVLTWTLWRGEKFLRYTVDETLRKVGDQISDVASGRMRNVINRFNQRRADDDRVATSHVILDGELTVHLLTKADDIEGQTDLGLASLCRQLEEHKDLLDSAESVTLSRGNKDEDWKVNYIETASGTVIVASECYEKTLEDYDRHKRSVPICLCMRHKVTGEERHYKTSAVFTRLDDDGRFQMRFNDYPQDIDDWEVLNVAIESRGSSVMNP